MTSRNPRDEPSGFLGFGITKTGAENGDLLGRMKPLSSIDSMNSFKCGNKCTGVLNRRACMGLCPFFRSMCNNGSVGRGHHFLIGSMQSNFSNSCAVSCLTHSWYNSSSVSISFGLNSLGYFNTGWTAFAKANCISVSGSIRGSDLVCSGGSCRCGSMCAE